MNLSSSSSSDECSSDEESVTFPKADPTLNNIITTRLDETTQPNKLTHDYHNNNYNQGKNDDEEHDDCSIEWEDGDSVEEGEKENVDVIKANSPSSQATGLFYRSLPSHDVIIDMNVDATSVVGNNDQGQLNKTKDKKKMTVKKRRRKRKKVNHQTILAVTPVIEDLALQIHRTHILTWVSRSMQLSSVCSDPDLLHLAHSLLPIEFISQPTASRSMLMEFQNWFTNNLLMTPSSSSVSRYSRKRKAKQDTDISLLTQEGQGDSCKDRFIQLFAYLSSIHSNDSISRNKKSDQYHGMTPHIKNQLFIIFARSNGWRTRYVIALEPLSQYVTISHPLFEFWKSMTSIFQRGKVKEMSTQQSQECAPAPRKKKKYTNSGQNETVPTNHQNNKRGYLSWAEVFVTNENKSNTSSNENGEWIHVDVERQLFNEPLLVEPLLASVHLGESRNKKHNFRRQRQPLSYAIAVENDEITDVTWRYSNSWSTTLKMRGTPNKHILSVYDNFETTDCIHSQWWNKTLKVIRNRDDETSESVNGEHPSLCRKDSHLKNYKQINQNLNNFDLKGTEKIDTSIIVAKSTASLSCNNDSGEVSEPNNKNRIGFANNMQKNEAFPTSKTAFKKHPVYVIPSALKKAEVLAPGSKSRICGMFKGECIYRRSDVSVAMGQRKWLYLGRKVKDAETSNPAKIVKARKKPVKKGFQTIDYGINLKDQAEDPRLLNMTKSDDGSDVTDEDQLYGIWQTVPWSPSTVGPSDPIPINKYKNVELDLLNPGLKHLDMKQISVIARRLGIPYAPCLVGFEGHHGNRTPSIRGIVVHQHNVDLLKEAHAEWESQHVEKSCQSQQKELYKRWRKLIVGLLTKDRLEKEYLEE